MHCYALTFKHDGEWKSLTFRRLTPLAPADYGDASLCALLPLLTDSGTGRAAKPLATDVTLFSAEISADGSIVAYLSPLAHFRCLPESWPLKNIGVWCP